MSKDLFVSYAQNGEDVVLWRALNQISDGRYVDVGASHPEHDSVTKAFYDRGWTGINLEPMPGQAARLRERRSNDVTIEAAVTSASVDEVVLHEVSDTGLSTLDDEVAHAHGQAGLPVRDIRVPATRLDTTFAEHVGVGNPVHFLKVDVEGAEADVLSTIDLGVWRPWVLLIEATAPNSNTPTHQAWEPAVLAHDYQFCLFDGLSRFYVAAEHAELAPALSYPACVLDAYRRASEDELLHDRERVSIERDQAVAGLVRWRGKAMQAWADAPARRDENERLAAEVARLHEAVASAGHAAAVVRQELEATRQTLSWRVTKPLRAARRVGPPVGS